MTNDKGLNHKSGCLWYDTKILKLEKTINSLLEKKKLYEKLRKEHYESQKEYQRKNKLNLS